MRAAVQDYVQVNEALKNERATLKTRLSDLEQQTHKTNDQLQMLTQERDDLSAQIMYLSSNPEGRDAMFRELRSVAKELEAFYLEVRRIVSSDQDPATRVRQLSDHITLARSRLPPSTASSQSASE